MAKHGGKRLGAGKPKGAKASHTLDAVEMRKAIIARVQENIEPLMKAKLDLALGHFEEREDKEGTIRIYQKAPDGNAIQYLFNQSIGKPAESVKLSGDQDAPIKIDITRMLNKAYGDDPA